MLKPSLRDIYIYFSLLYPMLIENYWTNLERFLKHLLYILDSNENAPRTRETQVNRNHSYRCIFDISRKSLSFSLGNNVAHATKLRFEYNLTRSPQRLIYFFLIICITCFFFFFHLFCLSSYACMRLYLQQASYHKISSYGILK